MVEVKKMTRSVHRMMDTTSAAVLMMVGMRANRALAVMVSSTRSMMKQAPIWVL